MMEKFRHGDTLDIRLVVTNRIGIKDVHIFFVHEEDEAEHIHWYTPFKEGEGMPLTPIMQTTFNGNKTIDEAQKPGVYVLRTVNFKTIDETTEDAPFPAGAVKFEVVQDLGEDVPGPEDAPTVMEGSDAPIAIKELSITRRLSGN